MDVERRYQFGAQSVKCAMCNFVSRVQGAAGVNHGGGSGSGSGGAALQQTGTVTVVIENPPRLDDQGNHVTEICVGVLSKDD